MFRVASVVLIIVASACLFRTNASLLQAAEPADSKAKPAIALTPEEARERLQRLVDLDLHEIPLDEVSIHLEQITGITVSLIRGPSAKGKTDSISFRVRQMPVQDVLDLMLGPIDWYWSLKGATLCIVSDSHEAGLFTTEVYDVHDLVYTGEDARKSAYNFEGLIEVITSLIDPTTWSEVGGQGAIKSFSCNGRSAIIVSQTSQAHRKIVDLLARLRALPQPAETPKNSAPPEQKIEQGKASAREAPAWWAGLASQLKTERRSNNPVRYVMSSEPQFTLLAWCVVDGEGILTLKAIVWGHVGDRAWQLAQYVCLPLEPGQPAWRRTDAPSPNEGISAANSFVLLRTYERPPTNRDVYRFLGDLSEPWSFASEKRNRLVAGEVRSQAWQTAIGEQPSWQFPADLPRQFTAPNLNLDALSRDGTAARFQGLESQTGKMTEQMRALAATLDGLQRQLNSRQQSPK